MFQAYIVRNSGTHKYVLLLNNVAVWLNRIRRACISPSEMTPRGLLTPFGNCGGLFLISTLRIASLPASEFWCMELSCSAKKQLHDTKLQSATLYQKAMNVDIYSRKNMKQSFWIPGESGIYKLTPHLEKIRCPLCAHIHMALDTKEMQFLQSAITQLRWRKNQPKWCHPLFHVARKGLTNVCLILMLPGPNIVPNAQATGKIQTILKPIPLQSPQLW